MTMPVVGSIAKVSGIRTRSPPARRCREWRRSPCRRRPRRSRPAGSAAAGRRKGRERSSPSPGNPEGRQRQPESAGKQHQGAETEVERGDSEDDIEDAHLPGIGGATARDNKQGKKK